MLNSDSTYKSQHGRLSWRWSPALICVAICAIAWAVACWAMPYVGDDLAYASFGSFHSGSIIEWPRWVARHWWFNNGRGANYLAPLMLHFSPRWVLNIASALFLAAYFLLTCRLARASQWRGPALIAILTLVMPWWDAMLLFDVQFNYIWAATAGLWAVWMVAGNHIPTAGWRKWTVAILFLIAGTMHEAMSLPLCCGFIAVCILRKEWPCKGRMCLLAFALGILTVSFSHGQILRAMRDTAPDDPAWLLVLKSDFMALVLIIVGIVAWLRMGTRRVLDWCRNHPLITLLAVAAMVSTAITAIGGIVGRSGWFAQTYAIIALVLMLPPVHRRRRGLSAALSLAITAYWGAFAWIQIGLNHQSQSIITQYCASESGIVYADYTPGRDIPWWLLCRTRHAPDDDDFYLLHTITVHSPSKSRQPIVVLPAAAHADLAKPDTKFPLKYPCGGIITPSAPTDSIVGYVATAPRYLVTDGASEFIVTPFTHGGRTLYYTAPRNLEPGDR